MKFLILFASLLALSSAEEHCYKDVNTECGKDTLKLSSCNAIYGDYNQKGNVGREMKAYALLHLERSYQYLLSSSFFNNYQTNRAGFAKLFRKLSDDAWEKSIELIKHTTKRGDEMDFSAQSVHKSKDRNYTVEVYELFALAKALDTQKEIAERAFHIHREASKNNDLVHDPEVMQYLEEEFIEKHADTIRTLAGHTSDIQKVVNENSGHDLSLALYMFDEYLQKIA